MTTQPVTPPERPMMLTHVERGFRLALQRGLTQTEGHVDHGFKHVGGSRQKRVDV
jgi:hypothetical protein